MKNENKNVLIVVSVVLAFLLLGGFGMMSYGGYGMMRGFYTASPFGGMWFFGGLFMALIIVVLILLIFWLAKQIQAGEKK